MSENEQEMVQVILKIPREELDAVKAETCVDASATAIVAFVRRTLREKGLIKA